MTVRVGLRVSVGVHVAVRSPVADVVWDRDALVVAEPVDTTVELRISFAVALAEPVRVVVVVPD